MERLYWLQVKPIPKMKVNIFLGELSKFIELNIKETFH